MNESLQCRVNISCLSKAKKLKSVEKIKKDIVNNKINNISELYKVVNSRVKGSNELRSTAFAYLIKFMLNYNGIKASYITIYRVSDYILTRDTKENELYKITENRLNKLDKKYKFKLICPIKEQILSINNVIDLLAFSENLKQKMLNKSKRNGIKITPVELHEVEGLLKNFILQRKNYISRINFKQCLNFEIDTNHNFSSEKISKVKLLEAMQASNFNYLIKLDTDISMLVVCMSYKLMIRYGNNSFNIIKIQDPNKSKTSLKVIDAAEVIAYNIIKLFE